MNSLCAALDHLREQRDAVQVDELLREGDVPRGVGQVLQSLQLGVHAGRLDPLVQLHRRLVLQGRGHGGHAIRREPLDARAHSHTQSREKTHRRGGQPQDGAVLDVVAVLRRPAEVSGELFFCVTALISSPAGLEQTKPSL